MPRFFFDTKIKGVLFQDVEGDVFDSAEAAIREGIEDAKAFGGDRLAHGGYIDHEEKIIRAESGEVVAQFTIEDAVRKLVNS